METHSNDRLYPPAAGDGHAVFFLATDGTIENWPQGAESVYQYSTDEMLGEPFDELWAEPPRQVTGLPELLERADHDEVRTRHRHRRGDGSEFLADYTVWPIRNGRLYGHAVVSREIHLPGGSGPPGALDVPESDLVDLFSRRLQSPLRVASGLLELYDRTGDERRLETARETVDRAEELVSGVVGFLGWDAVVHDPEPVDLAPVVTVARQGSVPVDVTFEAGHAPTVLGDAARLGELFHHVFQNCVVHRHVGTERVPVRIGPLDGGFYVEDDGSAVPESIREHVFDLGVTTADDRAGLGLSAVRRIATAHGWTVRVEESTTGGTRLEFTGVTLVE